MSKTNSDVLFSIIVATCNRPETLRDTLNGITQQDYDNYEIIIVNNGTQLTLKAAYDAIESSFNADNIKFFNFYNEEAKGFGPATARNIGISHAKGQYIAFCDDDDIWTYPQYLSDLANIIGNVEPELIVAEQEAVQRDTIIKACWFPQLKNAKYSELVGNHVYKVKQLHYFHEQGVFPHLNISVYKKSLIEQLQGFNKYLWYEEDLEFFLRVLNQCSNVYFLDKRVARHNIPIKSLQQNVTSSIDEIAKHIKRFQYCNELLLNPLNDVAKRYCIALLLYAAKHITTFFAGKKRYKEAVCYANFALSLKFTAKWWVFKNYLQLKKIING